MLAWAIYGDLVSKKSKQTNNNKVKNNISE
jgi:hypothetical protein